MPAISVVIITYNEQKNIERCLLSLQGVADEVVIVDSASSDDTVSISKRYNAKIFDHPFLGYAEQKNLATGYASHDWILSLDADEALTPELTRSILEIKSASPSYNAYRFPRLNNYCGKWIKHGGWYPDKKIRLYNRNKGSWKGDKVHESWQPGNSNESVGELKGNLLHYSFYSISDHIRKIEKYTELAAWAAVEKGKHASLFKIIFAPRWHFVTEYIFRLGFLDGYYGYVICRLSAYTAFIKYSKIRSYGRQK